TTETASALIDYLADDGDPLAITSPWQPISDGRGMATVSQIGGASQPKPSATPTNDIALKQNGAHER
ncbi:MAG TPA: hypothetical protein VFU63_10875, partial [Ktedonobacterales bacterium]|nr:hypothetical protein [Ktedonobacterales bacterium]